MAGSVGTLYNLAAHMLERLADAVPREDHKLRVSANSPELERMAAAELRKLAGRSAWAPPNLGIDFSTCR